MRRALFCLLAVALPACDKAPMVGIADADFELTSPSNDAMGLSGTPTFTWTTSIGTPTYRVQVSTDSGFSTLDVDQAGVAATTFTPVVTLNPGTVFFWRVIAERSTGDVQATGSPRTFTTVAPVPGAFMLSTPVNLSMTVPTTPTFTWTASLGAASYRLQISTSPGFASLIHDQGGITTTSAIPAVTLTPATAYFWQVIAESTSNVTASNAPFGFTTAAGPGSFQMVSPMSAATNVSKTPLFSWNASAGATSYRLEVSTDFNFTTVTIDQSGIMALFFTPATALASGTYYWRVTATGPTGTTPASPSPFFFTTN